MKDFAGASFSPETLRVMSLAHQNAIDTLPEPLSAHVVNRMFETILRTAREGERDRHALQRLALLELLIGPER